MSETLQFIGFMATIAGICVLGVIIYACGHSSGCDETREEWERKTVTDGKAEYYLDKNNERQWRWKP
jgi:hypothetical protein